MLEYHLRCRYDIILTNHIYCNYLIKMVAFVSDEEEQQRPLLLAPLLPPFVSRCSGSAAPAHQRLTLGGHSYRGALRGALCSPDGVPGGVIAILLRYAGFILTQCIFFLCGNESTAATLTCAAHLGLVPHWPVPPSWAGATLTGAAHLGLVPHWPVPPSGWCHIGRYRACCAGAEPLVPGRRLCAVAAPLCRSTACWSRMRIYLVRDEAAGDEHNYNENFISSKYQILFYEFRK